MSKRKSPVLERHEMYEHRKWTLGPQCSASQCGIQTKVELLGGSSPAEPYLGPELPLLACFQWFQFVETLIGHGTGTAGDSTPPVGIWGILSENSFERIVELSGVRLHPPVCFPSPQDCTHQWQNFVEDCPIHSPRGGLAMV